MKIIISFLLFGICSNAGADTMLLQDGTRIEGTIEGEMNGVNIVKTKYGSLNINKNNILSITPTKKPGVAVSAMISNIPNMSKSAEIDSLFLIKFLPFYTVSIT